MEMIKENMSNRARDVERIIEAVKVSASISEVLRTIGVREAPYYRKLVKRTIEDASIDIAHFGQWKVNPYEVAEDAIRQALTTATTVRELLLILGLQANSQSHYNAIERICKIKGLTIPKRLTDEQKHTRIATLGARKTIPLTEYLKNRGRPITSIALARKIRAAKLIKEICAICGRPPIWEGRILVLHLDHIDGDTENNDLSNLRFVCPNCHTQTATYSVGIRKRSGPIGYLQVPKEFQCEAPRKITEILIRQIVPTSSSYADALKKMGVATSGGNYKTLTKMCDEIGVPRPPRRGYKSS